MRRTETVTTALTALALLLLTLACVVLGWVAWSVGGMW